MSIFNLLESASMNQDTCMKNVVFQMETHIYVNDYLWIGE